LKLQDRAASSRVKTVVGTDGKQLKIGVVRLPSFYGTAPVETGRTNSRSASADVEQLLVALSTNRIDGLILDLRRNGGGSLYEAIKTVGLFIETGPVVMVREGRNVAILPDADSKVDYRGPVIVLVDRLSASASEIVAGALQDYGRAVVVGDSKTHGKGSVQTIVKLGDSDKYGSLKITHSLYYRITGSSTQRKGVMSDVVVPSPFEYIKTGEDNLRNAMEWTWILPSPFRQIASLGNEVTTLREKSSKRLSHNERYIAYTNLMTQFRTMSDVNEYSLKYATRLEQAKKKKELKDRQKEFEPPEEKPESKKDSTESDGKDDEKDIVLCETLNIAADLAGSYPDELRAFKSEGDACVTDDSYVTNQPAITNRETAAGRLRNEVLGLIEKLGDGDANIRREAVEKLKALGETARPVLEESIADPNPEIRMNIRDILSPQP